MTISVRLNEYETELIKSYAALKNISVSELVRTSILEKIEDEFDLNCYEEAYKEYLDSGKKSAPISELWKELEL